MIKVTNEIREAARRLLTKHNAGEKARAEECYEVGLARAESLAAQVGGTPNKARVREEAVHELPADKDMRKRLEAIADGKRKQIDDAWWRKAHGDVDRAKLDKIAAMADPTPPARLADIRCPAMSAAYCPRSAGNAGLLGPARPEQVDDPGASFGPRP
jgi:hypothetical protein